MFLSKVMEAKFFFSFLDFVLHLVTLRSKLLPAICPDIAPGLGHHMGHGGGGGGGGIEQRTILA